LDAEIVVHPIVREMDGLALSSRNVYLSAEERRAAPVLYSALLAAKSEICAGERDTLRLQEVVQRVIASQALARVDYVQTVDAASFETVLALRAPAYILLAVFIGKTRLIDNLFAEPDAINPDEFEIRL
jgi:pantoate--beta-alanine ligase